MENNFVTYEQFGAVGDGVTDDFVAMYNAHKYANENGLSIKVEGEPTYYIHDTIIDEKPAVISIRTDVDWGDAKIIIDDTDIGYHDIRSKSAIFKVDSEYETFTITDEEVLSRLSGIGEGTKKLDLELGYPALVVPYDTTQAVYNRYGAVFAARGGQISPAREILLIDAEGNIDESTPFMFKYNSVTKLEVTRVDVKPITVRGGAITTRASRVNMFYTDANGNRQNYWGYIARNIVINRSYTTLEGVKHYVVGEYDVNEEKAGFGTACYSGFFSPVMANEVTLRGCIMSARRCYRRPNGDMGGTYGFSASFINKMYLIDCKQANFYVDATTGNPPTADTKPENIVLSMAKSPVTNSMMRWGLGGSNFCKNMEYHGCDISRFDAHQGLYNGKIVNSSISFMALTGKGELLLENLHWISHGATDLDYVLYLRNDYGATWDGTITMKNCTVTTSPDKDTCLVQHSFMNWAFGYVCHFPNLIVDNLVIDNRPDGSEIFLTSEWKSMIEEPNLHLGKTLNVPYTKEDGEKCYDNLNPVAPPKFIKIINNTHGYKYKLTKDLDFFADTEMEGITFVDKN